MYLLIDLCDIIELRENICRKGEYDEKSKISSFDNDNIINWLWQKR